MDDSDPDIISFQQRSRQVDLDTTVRCPRCNRLILMNATSCEYCGVHFNGEAWQFSPSTKQTIVSDGRLSKWVIAVIVLILAASLLLL